MYIAGFLRTATRNYHHHKYGRVANVFLLRNLVLGLLCSFSLAKYSKGDVKAHLGLLHPYVRTLFSVKRSQQFWVSVPPTTKLYNPQRRGSFQSKVIYRECVAFFTEMENFRTAINSKFP